MLKETELTEREKSATAFRPGTSNNLSKISLSPLTDEATSTITVAKACAFFSRAPRADVCRISARGSTSGANSFFEVICGWGSRRAVREAVKIAAQRDASLPPRERSESIRRPT